MVAFGWRPDTPDIRDHLLAVSPGLPRELPATARVAKANDPPIGDQRDLGSCTAWTACYLVEQLRRQLGLPKIDPSELYLYWFTRYLEGGLAQTRYDSGATIRDVIRATAEYGTATEALWPYVVAKFASKPSTAAQRSAATRQVLSYQRCPGLDAVKASIADGFPVAFGWGVYESAMTDAVALTGVIPMPMASEQRIGGHACAYTEYDDNIRRIKFRNSWGMWGSKGYGSMPYEYVMDPRLSADFWTIRNVELGGLTG